MIKAQAQIDLVRVNDGESAYEAAVEGGYSESEEQFNSDLAELPNKANQTEVNDAIDTLSQTIEEKADAVLELSEIVNSAVEEIETKATKEEVETEIKQNTLIGMGYAVVNPTEPSVKLGKNDSKTYTKITDKGVYIGVNNTVGASIGTDADNNTSLKADSAVISTLKMRNAQGIGGLTWIAQENGHLTLKELSNAIVYRLM